MYVESVASDLYYRTLSFYLVSAFMLPVLHNIIAAPNPVIMFMITQTKMISVS